MEYGCSRGVGRRSGGKIVRVHDVAMMKDVVTVASALAGRRASTGQEHHA